MSIITPRECEKQADDELRKLKNAYQFNKLGRAYNPQEALMSILLEINRFFEKTKKSEYLTLRKKN